MSQWNNSYPYNNPFQEPGSWNREGLNSQHVNHNPAYFPTRQQFEPGNQYVSFGQFLSQIQTNGASQPNSTNYNGTQYQNYSGNHYSNFSNTTPTSSTQSDHHLNSYNYASDSANIPNSSESYQASAQSQYETASVQEPSSFKHEMLSKSNLTPTATEFIPKSLTVEPSTSTNQAIVSESSTVNGSLSYKNSRNNSKGKNWRERPSSSHHKDNSKQSNGSLSKNHKSSGNLEAFPEVSDPSPRQQENQTYRNYDKNKAYESSVRKVEGKNRKYDLNHKESTGNERGNSRQHDSTTRDSSRNYEGSTSENYEGSGRNYESNAGDTSSKSMKEPTVRGKGYEGNNSRSYDSGTRDLARTYEGKSSGRSFDSGTRDSARNFESNGSDRSYESPSRNYNGSRNYDSTTRDSSRSYDGNSRSYTSRHESGNKNQLKLTSKTKNKENRDDAGRTFYNSSANSSSQDARNARGEGSGRQRNWAGSQRVRAEERNMVDDEQFASNYTQYRDDHFERMGRDTQYREDRSERMGKDTQYREDRSERMGKAAPCREDRSERMGKVQGGSSPMKSRNNKNFNVEPTINKEMTQRERLSEQLDKGALECLVCCERVKQTDPVWSCSNCYHVLHLRCIRKWAMSSMLDGKWRCPACQNTNKAIPAEYRCMCGLVRNPEWQRGGGGAHTCGKACKRARTCPHPCTLLCHPGPCPPCQATVMKQCGCGAETRSVLCSSKLAQVCGRVCKKKLGCGVHECGKDCHEGDCEECTESVEQVCYCPAGKSRSVACTVETSRDAHYACGAACARVLACGAHVCRAPCHPPPCERCHLEPDLTETCPCGKMQIAKGARKACTDPIPVCGSICAKPLPCGPCQDKHFCKLECHDGACPVCPDKTLVQCNCGHTTREVPCADLPQMINNVFCQKKCNKKLSCGRHRCREFCCAVESHRCQLVCGRSLSCQLHRCQDTCHTGHCAPCPTVSFEELTCECGAEVILPPVRCGTKPPLCHAACQRTRVCGHEPHHSCHSGDCPPCVVLTHKRCHGGHEERKTIPCSQEEFSCGLPCGKPLPCGKHSCIKICHKGPCDTAKCTQPCNEKRPSCGHECGAACHAGDASCTCPSPAPCRRVVRARCACARRHADKTCADNARDRARIVSTLAASKIQESGSVDLSDMNRPGANLITLECDDECRVEQRTRQMALALQIRNPDVSAKLAPRYSEHVRSWAARDAPFAGQVHDKLTELVQRAKKSKQKTRSHSFPSMNWQKRQFIHELCEHFGCESVAYDAEPNRNVVATADKDKSWLPAMSVLEVLAREAGKRRVPGPMNRPAGGATHPATLSSGTGAASSATSKPSTGGWATLTSSNAWAARQAKAGPAPAASAPAPTPAPAASAAPKIDYFDYPPE